MSRAPRVSCSVLAGLFRLLCMSCVVEESCTASMQAFLPCVIFFLFVGSVLHPNPQERWSSQRLEEYLATRLNCRYTVRCTGVCVCVCVCVCGLLCLCLLLSVCLSRFPSVSVCLAFPPCLPSGELSMPISHACCGACAVLSVTTPLVRLPVPPTCSPASTPWRELYIFGGCAALLPCF